MSYLPIILITLCIIATSAATVIMLSPTARRRYHLLHVIRRDTYVKAINDQPPLSDQLACRGQALLERGEAREFMKMVLQQHLGLPESYAPAERLKGKTFTLLVPTRPASKSLWIVGSEIIARPGVPIGEMGSTDEVMVELKKLVRHTYWREVGRMLQEIITSEGGTVVHVVKLGQRHNPKIARPALSDASVQYTILFPATPHLKALETTPSVLMGVSSVVKMLEKGGA